MSTEPYETVLDQFLSSQDPATPVDPPAVEPPPAAPAEPVLDPPAPEEPDQTALLEVEAACKICRGRGENYTFKNDQPYLNHLKQDHPECFVPEA